MAYGYPYQQPSIPNYFNTNYMPQVNQMQPTQGANNAQTNVSWIYVNGIQGARDHIVQPGQTAWMMDNNDPMIHVKAVDNMGAATLKSFRLIEVDLQQAQQQPAAQIDVSQFATKEEIKTVADKLAKIESELGGLNT